MKIVICATVMIGALIVVNVFVADLTFTGVAHDLLRVVAATTVGIAVYSFTALTSGIRRDLPIVDQATTVAIAGIRKRLIRGN